MKIRITMLTENNIQRPAELTEEMVSMAWQVLLSSLANVSEAEAKCHVETVEFVDEEETDGTT